MFAVRAGAARGAGEPGGGGGGPGGRGRHGGGERRPGGRGCCRRRRHAAAADRSQAAGPASYSALASLERGGGAPHQGAPLHRETPVEVSNFS